MRSAKLIILTAFFSCAALSCSNEDRGTGARDSIPPAAIRNLAVGGLVPDTAYHFAVRTADDDSNWSALSNVASGWIHANGNM